MLHMKDEHIFYVVNRASKEFDSSRDTRKHDIFKSLLKP